jgi:hypothetical protein
MSLDAIIVSPRGERGEGPSEARAGRGPRPWLETGRGASFSDTGPVWLLWPA